MDRKDAVIKEQNAVIEKQKVSMLQSIKNLMDNLGLTAEQAMNALGISETDRKSILPFM